MSSTKRKMQRNESDSVFIEERNAYICKTCRRVTLIVHIHRGTTPFLIDCEACGESAQSFMYVLPPVLSLPQGFKALEPTKEWYSPIFGVSPVAYQHTLRNMKLSDGERKHVEMGGLLLRDRTDAKPIRKKIA